MIKSLGPFSYFQGYIKKKAVKFRQKLSNLRGVGGQVKSGLYCGNLDFNFNVDEEKTLLNLDQRYLNVHYRLKHVSRF